MEGVGECGLALWDLWGQSSSSLVPGCRGIHLSPEAGTRSGQGEIAWGSLTQSPQSMAWSAEPSLHTVGWS